MLGIEPKPFRMRNEHSTSELHPPIHFIAQIFYLSERSAWRQTTNV